MEMTIKDSSQGYEAEGFLHSPWRAVCAPQPVTCSGDDAQQSSPRDSTGASMSRDDAATAIPVTGV